MRDEVDIVGVVRPIGVVEGEVVTPVSVAKQTARLVRLTGLQCHLAENVSSKKKILGAFIVLSSIKVHSHSWPDLTGHESIVGDNNQC